MWEQGRCAQPVNVFQQPGEYLTQSDVILNFLPWEGWWGGGLRTGVRSEIVYITAADMRDKISGYHTVTMGRVRAGLS